jgi:hypothetical protein
MKTLKLELNLVFSEKITSDDDIQEIVTNVLNGLVRQTSEIGISPENSDTFIQSIFVHEPFSGVNDECTFV